MMLLTLMHLVPLSACCFWCLALPPFKTCVHLVEYAVGGRTTQRSAILGDFKTL